MKIGKSQVDRSVRVYGGGEVVVGNRSRIDQGVIICAGEKGVFIGDNVHVSHNVLIAGSGGRVELQDFCGIGAYSKIYTATENPFSSLTNPTIPPKYRKSSVGDVIVGRHALVYPDVIICPGVKLGLGSSVGAKTIVKEDVPDGILIVGEGRVIGRRNIAEMLELERQYLEGLRDLTIEEHCEALEEYIGIP